MWPDINLTIMSGNINYSMSSWWQHNFTKYLQSKKTKNNKENYYKNCHYLANETKKMKLKTSVYYFIEYMYVISYPKSGCHLLLTYALALISIKYISNDHSNALSDPPFKLLNYLALFLHKMANIKFFSKVK